MPETAGPEGWAEITATVCVSSRAVLNDTALGYLCCLWAKPRLTSASEVHEKPASVETSGFHTLVCSFVKGRVYQSGTNKNRKMSSAFVSLSFF